MAGGTRWPIFWIVLAVGLTVLGVVAVSTGRPYFVIPALFAWAEVWRSRPNRPIRDRYGNLDIQAFNAGIRRMADQVDEEAAEAKRMLAAAPGPEQGEWYAAWEMLRQPNEDDPDLADSQLALWYTFWKKDQTHTGESALE